MNSANACVVVLLCVAALVPPSLAITGGTPTAIRKHPYQAALLSSKSKLIGSGSIVGKKFILTTAYLAENYKGIQVRVGSTDSDKGGQLVGVEKVILHDKYDYQSYNVALLKLSKSIKYGKSVKAIKLAGKEGNNGTKAILTGYGTASNVLTGKKDLAGTIGSLQYGTQKLIDRATCQTQYNVVTLDESNFCAYNATLCACFEDGGDPLVLKNKLLGLNLGVVACCWPDMPQLYNNVPSFKKWIKKQIKSESINEKEEAEEYYNEMDK